MLPIKKEHIIIFAILIILILAYYERKKTKLVRTARKHIGEKESTTGAVEYGFQSAKFEQLMRANGFQQGYDWCAIFVKSVATTSFSGNKLKVLKKLMNPSSQRTYNNLVKASKDYAWIKIRKTPCNGCIVTWLSVSSPSHGHIGVVTSGGKEFATIEGNVQAGGGYDGVARKTHNLSEQNKTSGSPYRAVLI